MKANEFVKKHGWTAVVEAVKSTNAEETAFFESTELESILSKKGSFIGFDVKVHRIKYEEVKHLVESYELVGNFGGLEKAMDAVINQEANSRPMSQLAQAIADVESCMEVNHG